MTVRSLQAAGLALALAACAEAPTGTTEALRAAASGTSQLTAPLVATFFYPCVGAQGELVSVTGQLHLTSKLQTRNGTAMRRIHLNTTNASGVGETSGTRFRVADNERTLEVDATVPFSDIELVQNLRLVPAGSAPQYHLILAGILRWNGASFVFEPSRERSVCHPAGQP